MMTSLSAGIIIHKLLTGDKEVMRLARKVFPVVTDKALLPYVTYRRASLQHNPTKAGMPGADTVQVEVLCYAGGYLESVELAEAVRAALDYQQGAEGDIQIRSCMLSGSSEGWEGDAFVQELIFSIKI